jgi:hypothetical protein
VRTEVGRAERHFEVREAARAWGRAGAIDGATRTAIEAEYPDDRVRLSPALRSLVFVFTLLGAILLMVFFGLVARVRDDTLLRLLIVYGLVLAALAEWQTGRLRRAQGGTETATAVAAALCLVVGGFWFLEEELRLTGHRLETLGFLWSCAVLGLAAARWGGTFFAAGSAVCLLFALSRGDAPRLTVFLAGCLLLALGLWGEVSPRATPSHRRCAKAVQLVGLVAAYLAVHLGSWDEALLEGGPSQRASQLRPLFIAGTAALPPLLIGLAILWRRRFLLTLAALTLVASLVTVRFYVHLAPLWVVLILAGLASMALALLVERWLRTGPGRARGGFTDDPLFDDDRRGRVLEVAVAAAQGGSSAVSRTDGGTFQGGGGDSGGGGTTTQF